LLFKLLNKIIFLAASEQLLIQSGMQMIEQKTGGCIKFRQQVSTDTNWLSITSQTGCWSYVIISFNFK
jgi:hypothetical protein